MDIHHMSLKFHSGLRHLLEESSDTVEVCFIDHPGLKVNLHLLMQHSTMFNHGMMCGHYK